MNPNKKVLNSKNNSPWLLCPSKSFPGKFYYFNGLTGETAWSSNDTDGKIPKKGIQTITDKKHPYPEPFGPPADESTNTSSSSIRKSSFINRTDFSNKPNLIKTNFQNRSNFDDISNFCNRTNFSGPNKSNNAFSFGNNFSERPNLGNGTNISPGRNFSTIISRESHSNYVAPSPMFGQAVFPKYVSNEVSAPKMIWALTPMLVPEHKQMLDQITQYEPQDNTIQSSVQLTNGFQKPNRSLVNPFQYDKFNTSTPVQKRHIQTQLFGQELPQKFNVFNTNTQIFDPKRQTKEEACQTIEPKVKKVHTQTERNLAAKLLKPSRFVENLSTMFDTEKSPLCSQKKDDNVLDVSENTANKLSLLDKNDLRFLLVAKKKKNMDGTSKSVTKPENSAPKKRVTFNLVDEDVSSSEDVNGDTHSLDALECDAREPTKKVTQPQGIWYLAADLPILLTEFEYIEQFVLSDENCRLLIPYKVYSDVDAQSRREGCWQQSIFVARQIVRKLKTSPPHIIVQRRPDSAALSDEDAIIDCCWQLLQDECHVVLITNNAKLTNKAQIIGIECHTLNKVKESEIPKAVEPFDLKKPLTITVNNIPTENLFQQNLKDIHPLGLSETDVFPAHHAKANLFNNRNTEDANIFKRVSMSTNNNEKATNFKNTLSSRDDINELDYNLSRLDITNCTVENILRINNGMAQNHHVNKDRHVFNERNDKECAVSGIVKLNRVFDVDAELKNYCIKSDIMEFRANSRREEWICRLVQIMEEVLTYILLKDNCKYKKIMPPWSLYEAAQQIGNKFKNLPNIKPIVEGLSKHLFNISSDRGYLNKNMKPTELIKLIGYCMILVEKLKETLDYVELKEAKSQLAELIENMEDPDTDIDLTLDQVITPLRSEMKLVTNQPVVYRKHQSDILEYLKKHFPAMQSYELENCNTKVVRTNGKELNTVKIDSAKNISVENKDAQPEKVAGFEPKVIRNVNIIEAYEVKLKKNAEVDLDQLGYEETLSTISDDVQEEIEHRKNDKETSDVVDSADIDETFSCDFNNECVHAYSLVKSFLAELRRTFVLIYNFIRETMQEYQEGLLSEDKKSDIDIKTNMAHKYTLKIIDRLKSITIREGSRGPTLRDLLLRAGDYSEYDETMTRYKQVISKYLEQAEVLEEALKIMLTLTRYNLEQDSTNGGAYCGTFAATTVIRDQSEIIKNNMAVQLTN